MAGVANFIHVGICSVMYECCNLPWLVLRVTISGILRLQMIYCSYQNLSTCPQYNMMLEERMRSGYFLLSKTRYSMGTSAVSSLQLPSPDSETESLTGVKTSPVVLEDYKGDIMYHRVDVTFKDPMVPLPEDNGEESCEESEEKDEQKIRKREIYGTKEQTLDDENSETEKISKTPKKSSRKYVNRDPIRWFSPLPQQTLRQAQQDFKSSVSLLAECATVQSKLRTVNKEYRRLQEIKTKLDFEDKEE